MLHQLGLKYTLLITVTCLFYASNVGAVSQSNDYVLDDATITPNFTAQSPSQSLTGVLGAFQGSEQTNTGLLQEVGVTAKAILPTPLAPILEDVDGTRTSLAIKVSIGNNDRASLVQVRLVSTDGTYTGYFIPNSEAVTVENSWVNYNSWNDEWRQLKGLDGTKQYRAQVRVKTDDFTLSDFSPFSNTVSLVDNQEEIIDSTPSSNGVPLSIFSIALVILILALSKYFVIGSKRKSFGLVIDANTKSPIVAARVCLLLARTRTVLDSQTTDHYGRYYFVANDRQPYVLTVKKDGYDYWERVIRRRINRRVFLKTKSETNGHYR